MQLSFADDTARRAFGAERRRFGKRISASKSGVWKGAWNGL